MKALRMTLMVVAIVALAGSAMAQNTVYADAAAAMNGTNFGMILDLDGSTGNAFVEDRTPSGETVYRASFWFDANTLSMGNTDKFVIFLARHVNNNNIARLQFNYKSGEYRVRLQVKKNNNVWADCRLNGTSGARFMNIGDGPVFITTELVYGTAAVSLAQVTANGVTHYKDTYQSANWAVDKIRMGGPRMLQAQGGPFTGIIYFDEFESFRTLAP